MRHAPHALALRALLSLSVVAALAALHPAPPASQLRVYRLTETGAELLPQGALVGPGDQLQAAALVPKGQLAWIYSRDGHGVVTLHAAALKGGRWRVMPHAFRLDDAPTCEDFILFTGDAPDARHRLANSRCGHDVKDAIVLPLKRTPR